MSKRVLIVDDDKDILLMLEFGLKRLGSDYEIVTAQGSVEALALIEQKPFDLVVTDYMMKYMTGVDLARAIRRITPGTQVVLMSAYGSKRLRATTKFLGFEGYLDKPFDVQKIRTIIRNALQPSPKKNDTSLSDKSPEFIEAIHNCLKGLRALASASCVLLLTVDGHPIQIVGQTDGLRISNISALIAANFMGTTELANLLGNRSVFQSTFHAGEDYNLYIYDVNGEFLLATVFDTTHKPGVVWFYTKQAATDLVPLLEHPPRVPAPSQTTLKS